MQMREKVGKSRNTVFFQWFVAPEGRKVGSLKRRVRSQLARWEMKNCTPLWREAHFQVKRYKTPGSRSTFGSWDVEKVHARCRKSARRCGAKHVSKSKCKNTPCTDHFWKLRCRKSARRWREAHFEVKMYKTSQCRTTFGSCDVEKVHAVVARSRFPSQNVQNTSVSDHFWKLRCRKSARRCGAKHISKSKCTKHTMYGPFLEVQMSFRVAGARDCGPCQKWAKREGFVAFSTTTTTTPHYTPIHDTTLQLQLHLHYILLHYTPLRYTALNYTQLHYTTRRYTTLHSTTLHYITVRYITLHYTTVHYTTLPSTTLHYTTLHSTTLHFTTLHYSYNCTTTLHYTPLHFTPLHYTKLHYTTLHYTTLHSTTLRYTTLLYNYNCTTTLHYTPPHFTPLHYTKLHYTTLHYTTLNYTTTTTLHYIAQHYLTLNDTAPQIDR